jgi:hypothetical protein
LLGPVAWGASWAMVFPFYVNAFAGHSARLDDRIKSDYLFVHE